MLIELLIKERNLCYLRRMRIKHTNGLTNSLTQVDKQFGGGMLSAESQHPAHKNTNGGPHFSLRHQKTRFGLVRIHSGWTDHEFLEISDLGNTHPAKQILVLVMHALVFQIPATTVLKKQATPQLQIRSQDYWTLVGR